MSGATVLVVGGERAVADGIRHTLDRLGYTVPEAVATGEDAIRRVEELKPELVLMDVKLNGGLGAVAAASQMHTRFGTPIVYLTSHGNAATLAHAIASTPHGYLAEPFSEQDLRSSIEIALYKHELECKLTLRERWFEAILRSIGDAVIATSADGAITFMNHVAEALTGYGSDEALGKKIDEVLRLVDPDGKRVDNPVWTALDKVADGQLPPNTSLIDRQGAFLRIDDSVAPIVDDHGTIDGGVMIFRDVTERGKLEARLAQTERLASIGTMVAGMGHEINNPLSYAIGNVAFSEEELKSVLEKLRALKEASVDGPTVAGVIEQLDEIAVALHDASDGNERVRRIVDELKKFARPDTGPAEMVDLTQALQAAIKMTASTLRHHARLVEEFGATPLVEGHPGQLTQVFTNLIVNAAQAIGEGHAEQNEIRIQTTVDAEGRAVVAIRDTGPGIPAEILPRIFDAFFTTKLAGGGTGLGLAICHNLITSWGGTITVESTPGKGATFRVILPAARSCACHPKAEASPSSPPSRRGHVLVIDDERAIGEAVARMLRSRHDVVVEVDGRHALARIAGGETYDVIFCDLMMPNLSGMDFHKALSRSAPEIAKRIVFMTGGAFAARAQAFLDGVANISIDKPFTMESVRTIVKDLVK
jgi:PAS domain S-box-containing protein